MPIYPVAAALSAVLVLFADTTAAVQALPRPLVVAAGIALAIQLIASVLTRNRHLGAFAALVFVLLAVGLTGPALAVLGVPISVAVAGLAFRRVVPAIPWTRITEVANAITLIMLVLTIATTWQSGAFMSAAADRPATGSGTGPDIYLILLDAYPRSDTLINDFGFSNEPFFTEMERLGFRVGREARANYNLTILTLASMLNMEHIRTIDSLADPPSAVRAQYRAVTRALNQGRAFDELRLRGYEIVTVPSPFSDATVHTADRMYDEGGLTELEVAILQSGLLGDILPQLQRTVVTDAARARVLASLERTVDLARERSSQPKLVLTHILSPHEPILFAADGSPQQAWPCFPSSCSLFDGGNEYGISIRAPTVGQIEHLNRLVVETTRLVLEESKVPPIIIVFSDHGYRHVSGDPNETIKTLLLTYTPGRPGLIPPDSTPVNLLARILNAYHGASFPLVTEESYTIDYERLATDGIFGLDQVDPDP